LATRTSGHATRPPRVAGHGSTHFPFRIDIWDDNSNSIVKLVAGVDDFETAVVTYWAACRRWPKAKVTLRQVAGVVHRSWADQG
jgi:hypothetical protein